MTDLASEDARLTIKLGINI